LIKSLIKSHDWLFKLGLMEQEQSQEPGDILVVKRMATEISRRAQELQQFINVNNIRGARAVLAELSGAVSEAENHINRLSQEKGLVNLKTTNQ
jgi:hypothetical protein